MILTRVRIALGIAVASFAPALVAAQSGGRPGVIMAPRPESRPMVGFGRLLESNDRGRDSKFGRDGFDRRHGPFRSGFGIGGFVIGSTFFDPYPAPQPVAVPYPVPYYYPVKVYPRPTRYRSDEPPATPPNPANSKTLIIGSGHDGGGGVMRVRAEGDSALRLTWLGSDRPVREARFFLADSLRRSLRSKAVDEDSPSVVFKTNDLEARIAYTGLTIIYTTGATVTTLVPYPPESR